MEPREILGWLIFVTVLVAAMTVVTVVLGAISSDSDDDGNPRC